MQTAEIIVFAPLRRPLSYKVPAGMELTIGDLVRVPLGSRGAMGVVLQLHAGAPATGRALDLKPVAARLGESGLSTPWLQALHGAALEFLTPPGPLIALALPPSQRQAGGSYLKLANPGGAEPLAVMALKPIFLGRVLAAAKLRKILGNARYDEEIPPLLATGWLLALEDRPRATGLERWLRWNPAAPPLPARQKKAAELMPLLEDWIRQKELAAEINAPGPLLTTLIRKGYVQMEMRPQAWRGEGSLIEESTPTLNPEQAAIADRIIAAVQAGKAEKFLLIGPTGSGKTAVYLEALKAAAAAGRPGLLLVPEISLLPQTLARLQGVFGDSAAIFHSDLSDGARAAAYARVKAGEVAVAVGVRSGIFAPLTPGVIVIDEEQESAFRQSSSPAYATRHLAWKLADLSNCPLLLASATPSVESYQLSEPGGACTRLELTGRAGGAAMPQVTLLDMRGSPATTLIHPELVTALREALARGEKGMLLRNRRGFASQVLCRTCGYLVSCDACAVAMTLHREAGLDHLLCHLCGARRAPPRNCPGCGGDFLGLFGAGTQRLFEEALALIPEAKPLRLDRDSSRAAGGSAALLQEFKTGKSNLLVGTQMLAKGHDIAAVTVVGILSADGILGLPDFRAAERLFSLLTQAVGRAGRGDKAGRAYIQALNPDHYAIQSAIHQNYDAFFRQELPLRKLGAYPPFGAVSRLVFSDLQADRAFAAADALAKRITELAGAGLHLLGPAFCPVEKIQNLYRVQLILKSPSRKKTAARLAAALPDKLPAGLRIEMDPESLF